MDKLNRIFSPKKVYKNRDMLLINIDPKSDKAKSNGINSSEKYQHTNINPHSESDAVSKFNQAKTIYQDRKFNVLNEFIDMDSLETINKQLAKKIKNKNITVVLNGHGGLCWLFDKDTPCNETNAAKDFANKLKSLSKNHNFSVNTVILDACYSASELKDSTLWGDDIKDKSSPARALSLILEDTDVIGVNGLATTENVHLYGNKKFSYQENCVIFRNGSPTKATEYDNSTHDKLGVPLKRIQDSLKKQYSVLQNRIPDNGIMRTNSFSTDIKNND